ncbi:MAG: ribonuclease HII [Candidatus Diapherotrites archaeon]
MLIAGIDEAGRGPALGPMVMAVALIDSEEEDSLYQLGVKDSKVVPIHERERLYPLLQSTLSHYKTHHIHVSELDELMEKISLNEIEAMKIGLLLNELPQKPKVVFVDSPDPLADHFARRIENYISYSPKIVAEHKADANYPICGAASILAKVERDAAIKELQSAFSVFGDIGSGYSHDERTISFIQRYVKMHNMLPSCARKKWETNVRLMDARFQTKLV